MRRRWRRLWKRRSLPRSPGFRRSGWQLIEEFGSETAGVHATSRSAPWLLNPAPKDAWGREWIFNIPSETEGLDFDIVSIGADGEEGTDDDITNHDARKAAEGDDLGEFSGSSGNTPAGG